MKGLKSKQTSVRGTSGGETHKASPIAKDVAAVNGVGRTANAQGKSKKPVKVDFEVLDISEDVAVSLGREEEETIIVGGVVFDNENPNVGIDTGIASRDDVDHVKGEHKEFARKKHTKVQHNDAMTEEEGGIAIANINGFMTNGVTSSSMYIGKPLDHELFKQTITRDVGLYTRSMGDLMPVAHDALVAKEQFAGLIKTAALEVSVQTGALNNSFKVASAIIDSDSKLELAQGTRANTAAMQIMKSKDEIYVKEEMRIESQRSEFLDVEFEVMKERVLEVKKQQMAVTSLAAGIEPILNEEKLKSLKRRARKYVEETEILRPAHKMVPNITFVRDAVFEGQNFKPLNVGKDCLLLMYDLVFKWMFYVAIFCSVVFCVVVTLLYTLLNPLAATWFFIEISAIEYMVCFWWVFACRFGYMMMRVAPRSAVVKVHVMDEYWHPTVNGGLSHGFKTGAYTNDDDFFSVQDFRPDEQSLINIKHQVRYAKVTVTKNTILWLYEYLFCNKSKREYSFLMNWSVYCQVTNPLHTSLNRTVQERINSATSAMSKFQTIAIDAGVEALLHPTSNSGLFVRLYYPQMDAAQNGECDGQQYF